jgi:hypothetical protein
MTKYVVLRSPHSTNKTWELAASDVEAHSASGAVRAYLTELFKQDGAAIAAAYVAVPAKSWQPVKAKVETQTRIRIGGDA